MKKGFTLIELLAIIILLAGIFVLVYPKMTEIFEKETDKIDDLTLDTIYNAADEYIDNKNEFPKEVGVEYCILMETLDNENLIPFDVTEYINKAVRIKIGKSNNYHEIVDKELVDEENKCKSKEMLNEQINENSEP